MGGGYVRPTAWLDRTTPEPLPIPLRSIGGGDSESIKDHLALAIGHGDFAFVHCEHVRLRALAVVIHAKKPFKVNANGLYGRMTGPNAMCAEGSRPD